MANPYSDDFRARVASAILAGETSRAIAVRFEIATSTVVKWSRRLRETGSIKPAKFGGHRKCALDAHRAFILSQIDEVSHLTLHGLKDLLAESGVSVSHDIVWRFLRREGLSFKKTLFASKQERAGVVRRRIRWLGACGQLDPRRLVFIDETWIKINMAPLRGWGDEGVRLKDYAPDGR